MFTSAKYDDADILNQMTPKKRKRYYSLHKFTVLFLWVYAFTCMAVMFTTLGSYSWTEGSLLKADIPAYDDIDVHDTWKYEKWGVIHIFFMLNIPMYLLPVLTTATFLMDPFRNGIFIVHFLICLVILILWGLLGAIWGAIKWGQCTEWVECANQETDTTSPNIYWYFFYFGTMIIMVMIFVIIICSVFIRRHLYGGWAVFSPALGKLKNRMKVRKAQKKLKETSSGSEGEE